MTFNTNELVGVMMSHKTSTGKICVPVTGRVVAQKVGRGIALLFHDRGTVRGWVFISTPRPYFTPGKDPVPIVTGGWMGPKNRSGRAEYLAPPGFDPRNVQSLVAIPTELPCPRTGKMRGWNLCQVIGYPEIFHGSLRPSKQTALPSVQTRLRPKRFHFINHSTIRSRRHLTAS